VKGDRYEFAAIPLVAGILGVIFLVFAGAVLGLAWFVTLAFALIVVAATLTYVFTRGRSRLSPPETPIAAAHAAGDGVHRLLVVTNSCSASALAEQLAARSAGRPSEAFVIAPRTASRLAQLTGDESAYTDAHAHLDHALAALAAAGVTAKGQVGPADPLQALDDGLREFPADEVVFAASGDGFEPRLLEAARTHYAGPVTSVVVAASA